MIAGVASPLATSFSTRHGRPPLSINTVHGLIPGAGPLKGSWPRCPDRKGKLPPLRCASLRPFAARLAVLALGCGQARRFAGRFPQGAQRAGGEEPMMTSSPR